MRNPYFQLSRAICTAVQRNNLNISGKKPDTNSSETKGWLHVLFFFCLSVQEITFPSQKKNRTVGIFYSS